MKRLKPGKISIILTNFMIIVIIPSLLLSCKPGGRFFGDEEDGMETYEVMRGDIIQTVSTSGNVDSKYSNSYSLKTSGDVLQSLEKGDSFKKGDSLIELSSQRMLIMMDQAEENARTSQASLDLAKLNARTSQASLDLAKLNARTSQASLDLAKINYQQALDANHVAVQLAETNTDLAELAAQNAFKSLEGANNMAASSIESARIAMENSKEIYEVAKDSQTLTDVQKETYEDSIDTTEAAYQSARAQAQSSQSSAEGSYEQSVLNQSTTYWTNISSTQTAESQIDITAKNIEQAEVQVAIIAKNIEQAEVQVAIIAKNIEQAEVQLRLAQINLELVGLDSDAHIIYAPYDGIVLSSAYKIGEYAGPGLSALEIASNEFVIVSEVNETDIVNMELGQEVIISLDAYYLEELMGKIINISPVATNVGGVVSYKITVQPETENGPRLFLGLSASMEITTYSLEDIIFVPIQYVSEDDGIPSVNVKKDDESIEEVKVETGIFNFDFIEIKSGLSEGDIVVMPSFE